MEIRLTPLASGSKGNATLIQWQNNCLLIDCGPNAKTLDARLDDLGLTGADLTAIIVTHEHSDHINGAPVFARRHNLPIYMSRGTYMAASHKFNGQESIAFFDIHSSFELEGLHIHPFPVPHDARENCAFTFSLEKDADEHLGYLTDCGHITPHIVEALQACTHLALEANHCPKMLQVGPYPAQLKKRVGGDYGHLANEQAAALLQALPQVEDVRLMHLSEQNNAPEKALEIIRQAADAHVNISVAWQDKPSDVLIYNPKKALLKQAS